MSYILEALRKAEKQRELGQVPDIGSVHEAPTRNRAQRWPWALAVILILNAVIIGALFWPAGESELPAVKTAAAPVAPVARQPDIIPPDAAEQAPVPASEPEVKTAQPMSDLRSQRLLSEQASAGKKPLKPLPLPKVPPQVAKPEKQAAAALASPPIQPAVASKPEPLPVWPLVRDELYHQINTELKVKVHVYSKNREKRFVYLNRTLYHEGDQLLEGPQLEEITQNGVILSFRGERFRVPAR